VTYEKSKFSTLVLDFLENSSAIKLCRFDILSQNLNYGLTFSRNSQANPAWFKADRPASPTLGNGAWLQEKDLRFTHSSAPKTCTSKLSNPGKIFTVQNFKRHASMVDHDIPGKDVLNGLVDY
jgi:hypothetical protein